MVPRGGRCGRGVAPSQRGVSPRASVLRPNTPLTGTPSKIPHYVGATRHTRPWPRPFPEGRGFHRLGNVASFRVDLRGPLDFQLPASAAWLSPSQPRPSGPHRRQNESIWSTRTDLHVVEIAWVWLSRCLGANSPRCVPNRRGLSLAAYSAPPVIKRRTYLFGESAGPVHGSC
jgi:hypothetical protein